MNLEVSLRLRDLAYALLVIVVAAVLPPTASAQEEDAGAQESAPSPVKPHRAGRFLISPTISLQDVGVDGNVYNVTEPVSDFTFTVVPTVGVSTPVRRGRLTLHSTTQFVYFAREASERSVNENVSASLRMPLRRVTFTGSASYLNTRERPTHEIDARSRRKDYGAEAGISVALWPKLSASVSGRRLGYEFDGDAIFDNAFLAHELNRRATSVTATTRYAMTPLTSITFSGVVTETRFTETAIRDTDSRELLVGVELHPRALLAGSVSVGHERFEPLSPMLPQFEGIVGFVDLSYRLPGSMLLGIAGGRNLEFSYYEFQPYYLREGFSLSVRRQLLRAWDVQVSGSRFWHSYRRTGFLLNPTDVIDGADLYGGTDDLFDVSLLTGYQARPGTRITVGLTWLDRTSGFAYRGYNSVRIGTSVSYAF